MGSLGAIVAGLISMGVWYGLVLASGYEFGIVAWGIGAVIGFAAVYLAKGGNFSLGVIAGVIALAAIIGGQFLVTKAYVDELLGEHLSVAYENELSFAQAVTDAAESDSELRRVLTEEYRKFEPGFDGSQITSDDLRDFRDQELPGLTQFAEGNPNKEEYDQSLREFYSSPEMQWAMLQDSVSLFTLLWLFLGVGTAYKIARGEA